MAFALTYTQYVFLKHLSLSETRFNKKYLSFMLEIKNIFPTKGNIREFF